MTATTDHASTHERAGGGASEDKRSVKTLGEASIPHLRRIFEAHASKDEKWGPEQIKTFLQSVQHHRDTEDLSQLLSKPELDFNGFLSYMTSPASAITTPHAAEDLSWPLSAYYISSSHNTYLSGNQLSSDSTTETYTDALLRGCRCVEVDVWDGDDSDSESSASSESSDDEARDGMEDKKKAKKKAKTDKKEKRRSRYNMFKQKLPGSLSSRLERTSLGKKVEQKESEKHGAKAVVDGDKKEHDETNKTPEVGVIEPRVLHGYTLTKEVSFRDVCVAIRDSAFTVTDLPLIVSLEVHCGPEQQGLMVDIMKETWKGLLVEEPESNVQTLPAPQELRGKILIKVKYAPPGSTVDQYESGDEQESTGSARTKKQKKPAKVTQELSRLGIYTQSVSFKSFSQPEATMPTHIFSLSEKKFLDYHENERGDLVKHNRDFLMRTYPAGFRISSSNLNPALFWGAGTQIVALNWQQTDEGTMLNEGMFAGTGGWVLKPEGYRPNLERKGANEFVTKTLSLKLTMLAAQSIPLPPEKKSAKGFHPYVKVELHVDGCQHHDQAVPNQGHEREGEYKEKTRTHSGRDGVDLSGEVLEFRGIGGLVDQLTFVRFTVRDDEIGRDDLAAWACVRLDRLGEGYRFVHLMDAEGRLTDGVVLLKVEKTLV